MRNNKELHILVIDDDREITLLLTDYLSLNHFKVTYAYDGLQLNRLMQAHVFDLIILDIMLPGKDGLTLCKEIRQQSDVPILMLSAAQTEADRVIGLELGADDYIVKPFSPRELLARVKSHLRRSMGELKPKSKRISNLAKLKFDTWILDRDQHSLIGLDQVVIALSQREYNLLIIFLEHPKHILSRSQLMDLLYDRDMEPNDRSIDVLIGRIRKKIETNIKAPKLLITIRGGGYQMMTNVESVE